MKSILRPTIFEWAALFSLLMILGIGCSSPSGPKGPPYGQLQFKTGEISTYQNSTLDSMTGLPVPGSQVTVTQTLVASNVPLFGRDSVQIEQQTYSDLSPTDSLFGSQSSTQDLFIRNFGLDAINSNPLFVSLLGGKLELGWNLAARMAMPGGTQWSALDTTLTIKIQGVDVAVHLHDNASMLPDTTYSLAGKSYAVRHAQHQLALTITAVILSQTNTITDDVYVSPDLGASVYNVVHPAALSGAIVNLRLEGAESVMLSHQ